MSREIGVFGIGAGGVVLAMAGTVALATVLMTTLVTTGFAAEGGPIGRPQSYVYAVIVHTASGGRTVSGFRADGHRGIVTAAHALAGAEQIDVRDDRGTTYTGLSVRAVAADRDLAVIGSDAIDGLGEAGLPEWRESSPCPKMLYAVGFAQGLEMRAIGVGVQNAKTTLGALLPEIGGSAPAWGLDAALPEGMAGAPLIAPDGGVVATVSGRDAGDREIAMHWPRAWAAMREAHAVPTGKGTWRDFEDLPLLLPISEEFESTAAGGGLAATSLEIRENGDVEARSRLRNTNAEDGFCARPYVVFYDRSGAPIHEVDPGSSVCVDGVGVHRLLGTKVNDDFRAAGRVGADVLSRTHAINVVFATDDKEPDLRAGAASAVVVTRR